MHGISNLNDLRQGENSITTEFCVLLFAANENTNTIINDRTLETNLKKKE